MNDDRKHLTALEVDKLLAATKGSRLEARDRCLLLLMFRHGLKGFGDREKSRLLGEGINHFH